MPAVQHRPGTEHRLARGALREVGDPVSYVASPLHGFLQLLVVLAFVVLALRARKILRLRAALERSQRESNVLHTAPIGEACELRPGTWFVRLSASETVFGLSRDEALERAFQPRKAGVVA